jgi:drug/metabolite transporter (DMT)-like permease
MMLAGLLYLGAGIGLTIVSLVTRRPWPKFRRADWWQLALIAGVGGFLSPTLLMLGLQRVSGLAASLLLNLEAVFTMGLAVTFFGERLNRSEWMAATLILGGAGVLSYRPGSVSAGAFGVMAIAGACVGWGLDNNLMQRVSAHDPLAIVQVKTLTAGAANVALALTLRQRVPGGSPLMNALLVGFFCYGISIVLDVYALRFLGAAREAAIFATAPFLGAVAAVLILGDHPGITELIAGVLMAAGIAAFRTKVGPIES